MVPTGYWIFFSNPKKWAIDEFLLSGQVYDFFSITRWQKNWFKKGQLGLIRVGHDQRTKEQLKGNPRLKRGIYAIVEILGTPFISTEKDEHWFENSDNEGRYNVEIKYLKNLLRAPISLDHFREEDSPEYDKYLVHGFQAASMPLNPQTFDTIITSIGGIETLEFEFKKTVLRDCDDISYLEEQYFHAAPGLKECISVYIERSQVARNHQRHTGYNCEVCEGLDLLPFSFVTIEGEMYAETHHVMPTDNEKALSVPSLITVCPYHHRQLHYGKSTILENNTERFVFEIDQDVIEIKKKFM
jgi:hypothetical protein